MKKLLSILSISCIAGSTSSSVVSCSNTAKKPVNKKVDISTLSFTQENYGQTLGSIYESIREQLAAAAKISPYTIKDGTEKNNVLISVVHDGKEVSENDTTVINGDIQAKSLQVKVEVSDNSSYFVSTNNQYVTLSNLQFNPASILNQLTVPVIPVGQTADQVKTLVLTKLGRLTNETAVELKSKVTFKIQKDGKDFTGTVAKGDKLSAVFTKVEDPNFVPLTEKDKPITKDITVVDKAKALTSTSITLSSDVIVAGMSYDSVYGIVRDQIAAIVGINSLVILDGAEKDNVQLSLIVNGNAVTTGTIVAGDKVSFKYQVTNKSIYYQATKGFVEIKTPITVNKVKVTADVLSGLTFKVGNKYEDMYNAVREKLALAIGLKASDIEADKTASLWLNIEGISKPLADSATQIKKDSVDKMVSLKLVIKGDPYFVDLTQTFNLSKVERA